MTFGGFLLREDDQDDRLGRVSGLFQLFGATEKKQN